MTAINLPGQTELPIVVDHKAKTVAQQIDKGITDVVLARLIAESLRIYEERPTSETWSRIQQLAAEILK